MICTTRQSAFNKELELKERYKGYNYNGIKGRYSGWSEWITVRPKGKPIFQRPDAIEERFIKAKQQPLKELEVPDKYTVYLLFSNSKKAYKCAWCKSENLEQKIKNEKKINILIVSLSQGFELKIKIKLELLLSKTIKIQLLFLKKEDWKNFNGLRVPHT